MAFLDNVISDDKQWLGASQVYEPITPHDSTNLPYTTRAIVVHTAGNVVLIRPDGTAKTLTLPAGMFPIACTRINSTNTTATGLSALY